VRGTHTHGKILSLRRERYRERKQKKERLKTRETERERDREREQLTSIPTEGGERDIERESKRKKD